MPLHAVVTAAKIRRPSHQNNLGKKTSDLRPCQHYKTAASGMLRRVPWPGNNTKTISTIKDVFWTIVRALRELTRLGKLLLVVICCNTAAT